MRRYHLKLLRLLCDRIISLYQKKVCIQEFQKQRFTNLNERAVEYRFVFQHLSQICPTTVLDVGTGATALPHLMRTCGFVVTATDNVRDFWPNDMVNRHWHVIDDDITDTKLNEEFDFITCISVLEHIKWHRLAVKSMFSLLKPSGYIILTFPYNENKYVENVYKLPDSSEKNNNWPFMTQAFSRSELNDWLEANNGNIIEQEYWQFFSGEYWTTGKEQMPPRKLGKSERHQITCLLIQKGDYCQKNEN